MRRLAALAALATVLLAPALASAQAAQTPGAPAIGLAYGLTLPPGSSTPLVITAINGPVSIAGPTLVQHGGWAATYNGTPPTNLQSNQKALTVSRVGFTCASAPCAATTYTDTVYVQTNIRTVGPPYANPMPQDTVNVGLSRTLYDTDSIAGVTNNTDEKAPPPVCNWEMPGRRLITTTTITPSLACFGIDARGGSEIAGVTFTITDGTNSDTCTANSMADDGLFPGENRTDDLYSCPLSTANLSAGVLLKLDAKAYSWLGSVADGSVADSSTTTSTQSPTGSVERQFSTRYYIKDSVRTGVPSALVCPASGTYPSGSCPAAGSDTTGSWGYGLSGAAAHPFATSSRALATVSDTTFGKPWTAMSGCTGGCADGAVIYLSQAAADAGPSGGTSRPQLVGALEMTSDPAGTGKATLSYSVAFRPRLGVGASLIPTTAEGTLWLENLNYTRTGSVNVTGEATNKLEMQFTNDVITLNSNSAAFINNGGVRIYASTLGGIAGSLGDSTGQETRNLRGNVINNVASITSTSWNDVGNEWNGTSGKTISFGQSAGESGTVWYNNGVHWPDSSGPALTFGSLGGATETKNIAVVQNLIEVNYTATTGLAVGLSRDCDTATAWGALSNLIYQYNTTLGYGAAGRVNMAYDTCSNPPGLTTPTTIYRPHHLWDFRGNITGSINFIKDDWYSYSVNGDTTLGPNHIGSWPIANGSNVQGNLQRYEDTTNGGYGGDRQFAYGGRGSVMGTSGTTDTVNPLFVTDAGTSNTGSAGAGYGDYHLQSGSPCKGVVERAALAHGFYGTARPTTGDSCGVNP